MPAKLIFLHVPKTGGTSLHQMIASNFNENDICPSRFSGELNSTPLPKRKSYKYYSGHFLLGDLNFFDKDIKIISLLREPKSRVISLYKFWRRHTMKYIADNNAKHLLEAKSKTFADFLNSNNPAVVNSTDNAIVRSFSSTTIDKKVTTEDCLQAIANAREIDHVVDISEMINLYNKLYSEFRFTKSYDQPLVLMSSADNHRNWDPLEQNDNISNSDIECEEAQNLLAIRTQHDQMLYESILKDSTNKHA